MDLGSSESWATGAAKFFQNLHLYDTFDSKISYLGPKTASVEIWPQVQRPGFK